MAEICVTGAFGYSGRTITERLLGRGHVVRTLTRSVDRENPFGTAVSVFPLDFQDEQALDRALRGVDVLVNTYWVRFSKAGFSQTQAVAGSKRLFRAARRAGVGRILHTSITNPSAESPYEYFRGKAVLEAALGETGVPSSVLRPAVFFGGPDVLLNNIAWMLRRFPVFGIVGDGSYRLQPIHVGDFADLVVEEVGATGDRIVPAIGPETWTYRDLVSAIGVAIGYDRPIVRVPRWTALATAALLGTMLGDVVLTAEELDALMDGLLAVDAPPTGKTSLRTWLAQHGDTLGVRYANEVARRRDRRRAYERLA